jgi:hypothetical protein
VEGKRERETEAVRGLALAGVAPRAIAKGLGLIEEILPNMDTFITNLATLGQNSMVNVWVTFNGIGYRPKADLHTPRQTLLALWKRHMHDTKEDWRAVMADVYDEEEYKWTDHLGLETNAPLIKENR